LINLLSPFQNVPNLKQDVNFFCCLITTNKIHQEDSFTALENPRLLSNVSGFSYAQFDKRQTFEFKKREIGKQTKFILRIVFHLPT